MRLSFPDRGRARGANRFKSRKKKDKFCGGVIRPALATASRDDLCRGIHIRPNQDKRMPGYIFENEHENGRHRRGRTEARWRRCRLPALKQLSHNVYYDNQIRFCKCCVLRGYEPICWCNILGHSIRFGLLPHRAAPFDSYWMPRIRLRHTALPKPLTGWLAINDLGLPRFWATVWADILLCGVAETTRGGHLAAVENSTYQLLTKPMVIVLMPSLRRSTLMNWKRFWAASFPRCGMKAPLKGSTANKHGKRHSDSSVTSLITLVVPTVPLLPLSKPGSCGSMFCMARSSGFKSVAF